MDHADGPDELDEYVDLPDSQDRANIMAKPREQDRPALAKQTRGRKIVTVKTDAKSPHVRLKAGDMVAEVLGLVYLGSSAKVAFVETILRDSADGRGVDCVIDLAEIEKRSIATIEPITDLRLINLTGNGLLKLGVPSDVVGARDQTLAQQWSVAFHDHPDQPDGILFPLKAQRRMLHRPL